MLLPLDLKVHLASAPVDMRKSYQTLGVLVKNVLNKDPFCGHLFVFYNKRKDLVKILYWQKNGFCLWQKKLEDFWKKSADWGSVKEGDGEVYL